MKLKCDCGLINETELNPIIYEITGRPKLAASLICMCGK